MYASAKLATRHAAKSERRQFRGCRPIVFEDAHSNTRAKWSATLHPGTSRVEAVYVRAYGYDRSPAAGTHKWTPWKWRAGGEKKVWGLYKLIWIQRVKISKAFKRDKMDMNFNQKNSQKCPRLLSAELLLPPPPSWKFQRRLYHPPPMPRYRKYSTAQSGPAHWNFWMTPRTRGRANAMKLTDEVFRSFRVAKVFRENTDRVNCIDFSANGEHMICSSNDDSIVIYCCQEGRCALNGIYPNCDPPLGDRICLCLIIFADRKEPCTVRSMAVTCSNTHTLLILSSTLQIKLMVSKFTKKN